ncbi:MAG: peptidoglycan-binding protein [Acidimicrobiales bacterium]|nr:peptidoglycan-binding protein [Acidimicrobiales bacterium]
MSLGHLVEPLDGIFGSGTEAAVKDFQRDRSIDIDGICGPQTWDQLVEAGHRLGSRLLYLQSPPLRGDDVADLQRLLTSLGFPMSQIDGIHGQRTADALVDFQLNAGLVPDGVCGPITVDFLHRVGQRFGEAADITRLQEKQRFLNAGSELHGYKIVLAESGGLDAVVASLRRSLSDSGAEVLTTHHPDWSSHAQQANMFDADFCIGVEIRDEGSAVCHFLGDHFESPTGKQLGSAVAENLQSIVPGISSQGMRLPLLRETRMPALLLRIDDVTALVRNHHTMSLVITDALRSFIEVGLD